MANTTTENGVERPYKPSWVDRFTNWVEKLPVPGWVFYAGLGLGLILIQVLFLWFDGGLAQAEVLLPVIVFNALSIPFGLALMHFLDDQAVATLDSIRSTLKTTEPEFHGLRYKLSNMPFRATLIAGLTTLVFYLLMERLWISPVRFAGLEQLPVFAIVFHIFDKSTAFIFGALFYHTVRQLCLVSTINSNCIRISLFNLGPSQAFSKLTASTAVGLVVGIYGWMLINPDLLADPISLGFVGTLTVLAVAVFIWPLWGVHRLVEMEKARALREVDHRFEAVFAKLDQHLHDEDYAETERLNGTIASLEIKRKRISEIPTWPWRPETARFALTAIALPLILTILQLLAVQAFGR
jgi:hypothetical protein